MKRHPKEAMPMNDRIALIAQHIDPSRFQSMPCHITTAICRYQGNLENLEKVHGLRIEDNVRLALSKGLPVVALESTIISHGMPYPQNLTTAREVEDVVRKNGAVPATIAIIGGVPCIGLTSVELQHLARMGTQVIKTARRDISHVVAKKADGATTVSATMCFAAMAGIQVFVTGGIGGVHRHGETTLDISSDLTELGRTPVTVVSAGVKSILDIPRTLEYLETQGVPVVGYQTDEFPAFFTRKSGCKVSAVANDASECAAIIDASAQLSLGNGILIAVPIPEQYTPLAEPINTAIEQALQECREQNINGNAVTPFLLKRVNEITGGASLAANIALVKNNARVGAEVAASLCAVSSAHKKLSSSGDCF